MKIAYLVCFVALLQVSKSEVSSAVTLDTNTTDLIETSDTEPLNSTEYLNSTEESPSETETLNTTISYVDETMKYETAAEETSTEEEQQPTTVEPSPSHSYAALLQPSILALLVPVCLRLSSIKLLGLV